jgi:hypothetical protein
MNKRQVVVLWIVALVLASAAYFSWSGKSKSSESKTERSRGQTVLSDFVTDQVAKIKVNSGETSTTLVRKDGKWTVEERGGYPAKSSTVNEFLDSLSEVKVVEGVEAAPSYAPRFGMDPSSSKPEERGIEVVLSNDAGTELAHITLGKNIQPGGEDPMASMMGGGGGVAGRFLRNHADESGVYKVSEMFSAMTAEPKGWLNTEFVKIEKIKSVSVSPKGEPDKVAWKVTRADENGEFTLDAPKAGETLDATAGGSLKSLLSYASFEDVIPAAKAGELAKPQETRTAKIETFEGFVYTITLTPTETEKPKEGEAPAPPPEESYLMTVDVEGTVPAERKKEEKESAEDAKAKDDAFIKRKEELEKRLAAEKALAGKTFKVTKSTVDGLLKERSEIAPQQAPGGAASATPAPGAQPGQPAGFPGSGVTTPPVQVPPAPPRRKPVEAVTPPIAIPPLEEGEQAPKEVKPAEDKPAEDKPAEEKKDQ